MNHDLEHSVVHTDSEHDDEVSPTSRNDLLQTEMKAVQKCAGSPEEHDEGATTAKKENDRKKVSITESPVKQMLFVMYTQSVESFLCIVIMRRILLQTITTRYYPIRYLNLV